MKQNKLILNLACGTNIFKDNSGIHYINVDKCPNKELKKWIDRLDIEKTPYPYDSNTFDAIYCFGALGYLEPKNFFNVIEELYRILKPKGKLIVTHSNRFNPMCRTFLSWNSFRYFSDEGWYKDYFKASFKVESYTSQWWKWFLGYEKYFKRKRKWVLVK